MEETLDYRTNNFDRSTISINEYLGIVCSRAVFPKVDTLPEIGEIKSDTRANLEKLAPSLGSQIYSWFESDLAIEKLEEVYRQCSFDDWDGYDAAAISKETYFEARRLLRLIPSSCPLPDILPEPEGEIGFEWYRGKGFSFVISVGGNNIITYAGQFGENNEIYGSECFRDSMPQIILYSLERLFQESNGKHRK